MVRATESGLITQTAPALAGVTPEGLAPDTVAEEVIPSIGAHRTDKHLYYWNGKGPVPSVTNILGIIDKPAIGVHKAKEAARAVWNASQGPVSTEFSAWIEEDVIKWALKEADKARDTAANLGSSVHILADLLGTPGSDPKGFEVSEVEIPYVRAYQAFLDRYSASNIISSEHMVWSLNGYAGTYDLIMLIDGDLWLIDIKTSGKGPYPEWALQLAGYRWSDYIILPGQVQPHAMPQVQKAGVLHLRPDLYPDPGYQLWEYPITYKDDYIGFLAALELYNWKQERRHSRSKLRKH